MRLEDPRYPAPGDAFIVEAVPLTIKKVFRVDEIAGHNDQRQFVVVDQQNGRWLIEEVRDWTAGPRFVVIRPLTALQPPLADGGLDAMMAKDEEFMRGDLAKLKSTFDRDEEAIDREETR
jgi:hypothetical protein